MYYQTGARLRPTSNNLLVSLLPAGDRERVLKDAVATSLAQSKELYSGSVDAIYFPLDSVISPLVGGGDSRYVETATIGNEGAVGALSYLNDSKLLGVYVVQLPGEALVLRVERFFEYLDTSPSFRRLINRYLFALTRQIVQVGACNRLHSMSQRCARWLLEMRDRAGTDTFSLTQRLLSEMLTVRRATVNEATRSLQASGLIRYRRGTVTVVDPAGLTRAACPCYDLIRREYENLASN